MRISHEHKIAFISIPKCGTHTGFKIMEDYRGETYGSYHNVVLPEDCKDYTCFTFVRDPFDRAVAMWNTLVNPEQWNFIGIINSKIYLDSVKDNSFKTFCHWLGTLPEDTYLYELNSTQCQHLKNCNANNLIKVKLDDALLININRFMYVETIPEINITEHKSITELADQECMELLQTWAKEDMEMYSNAFRNNGYKTRNDRKTV